MPRREPIRTGEELRAWRTAIPASLPQLARSIGRSQRILAAYERGERPIPVVVGWACAGIGSTLRSRFREQARRRARRKKRILARQARVRRRRKKAARLRADATAARARARERARAQRRAGAELRRLVLKVAQRPNREATPEENQLYRELKRKAAED